MSQPRYSLNEPEETSQKLIIIKPLHSEFKDRYNRHWRL